MSFFSSIDLPVKLWWSRGSCHTQTTSIAWLSNFDLLIEEIWSVSSHQSNSLASWAISISSERSRSLASIFPDASSQGGFFSPLPRHDLPQMLFSPQMRSWFFSNAILSLEVFFSIFPRREVFLGSRLCVLCPHLAIPKWEGLGPCLHPVIPRRNCSSHTSHDKYWAQVSMSTCFQCMRSFVSGAVLKHNSLKKRKKEKKYQT